MFLKGHSPQLVLVLYFSFQLRPLLEKFLNFRFGNMTISSSDLAAASSKQLLLRSFQMPLSADSHTSLRSKTRF